MIVWKCWGQRTGVWESGSHRVSHDSHLGQLIFHADRRAPNTPRNARLYDTRLYLVLLLLHTTRQNHSDNFSVLRSRHLQEITPKCPSPTRHSIHSQSIKPKHYVSNSRNGKNGSRPTIRDVKRVAKTSSAILKSVNHRFCSKYINLVY